MELIIKHRPDDFFVSENALPALRPTGAYHYWRLRKTGYTTFEAVAWIAATLGVAAADVSYAGLKDEDGVTEQWIAIAGAARGEATLRHASPDGARRLELQPCGHADRGLAIGELLGNSFAVTVRGLAREVAEAIAARTEHVVYFLNYFDDQRFGVPGAPRLTHRIGRALLDGDAARALELVIHAELAESAPARDHRGSPEAFFAALDPRVTSLYLSASSSEHWNDQLAALVRDREPGHEDRRHGLAWCYAVAPETPRAILAEVPELPFVKYRPAPGRPASELPAPKLSRRSTVIQAFVRVVRCAEDDSFAGKHKLDVAFTLPGGCYATMCLRQLVLQFAARGD
ncbi:MAG TPA: tRNA pseudouridine(13) synthase TruD [Kofleriaceae bacterium]|jgi:tRNA pseudouridine13 synthase|nr:tRNA pseudouridine(13) synthase TruD [Kofleriaceae bacterium]